VSLFDTLSIAAGFEAGMGVGTMTVGGFIQGGQHVQTREKRTYRSNHPSNVALYLFHLGSRLFIKPSLLFFCAHPVPRGRTGATARARSVSAWSFLLWDLTWKSVGDREPVRSSG
jgi:hypothetical protein